jgi:hypothetical protein
MAFDENKYKKLFESRYGAGSFDSGLSQAREIGKLKVQAEFAKKSLIIMPVERISKKGKEKDLYGCYLFLG